MALQGGGTVKVSYPVGTGGVTKHRVVRLGASGDAGKVIAVSAIDQTDMIGVADETVAAGGYVAVTMFGKCKLETGTGGLTSGNIVAADATGKGVTGTVANTTTATAFHFVIGKAEDTVAAGEIGTVFVSCPPGVYINTTDATL